MITITIDNKIIQAEEGKNILQVAKENGIHIPTFCHLDGVHDTFSCRICVVEIVGSKKLAPACNQKIYDGMVIHTASPDVLSARRNIVNLLISNGQHDCMSCEANGDCSLQSAAYDLGIHMPAFKMESLPEQIIDDSSVMITRDNRKCILCNKCVTVCSDLVGNKVLSVGYRGSSSEIICDYNDGMGESSCVQCGNCVQVCPTGALVSKKSVGRGRAWDITKVRTTCPYCGVGCQMYLHMKGDEIVGISAVEGTKANDGRLCVKGRYGYDFVRSNDRLKTPLIKENGVFREASWQEALTLILDKMNAIKKESGPDAFAGLSSARCTNEENYVFQKMMRAAIGTNNVDHCARLCHASTVAGLATTLGSGAMTNTIDEVKDSDLYFIIGSNTTETHPVIGMNVRQGLNKGAKLIVAEPREIPLAKQADLFLQIKPGTNIPLLNGMMHVIIKEDLLDKEYVNSRTEGFEELKEVVKEYTPEVVARICGIDSNDLVKAAKMYATAPTASILYAMGVTQHSSGTEGVMSVSNMALLCGNIGKYACGVNPLRGQNNVQGACDMGALPTDFPGYQKVANPDVIKKFEKAWGVSLSDKKGLTATEMFEAILEKKIRCLYIMGENPMVSDPDSNHVEHSLKECEFVVVQDIFMTETAQLADVVLPATSFAEKNGTFTNTERRVQLVNAAMKPIGDTRLDYDILIDIMKGLGYENSFANSAEILEEIASVTPSYGGISIDKIQEDGIQWPCLDKDHPGTPILHTEKFSRGEKAIFKPATYRPAVEQPDEEYPFIFTTGRILYHYHTRTMTGKVDGLNKLSGHSYVEMNPEDAANLGIAQGEIVEVSSRRGKVNVEAHVTDTIEKGVLFMPFHFEDGKANLLTNAALDPIAKIPELKVCAATVKKN